MEILKIFSDANDEERLYSVLMSEEEVSLYSDLMEYLYSEEEEKPKKKNLICNQSSLRGNGRAYFIGGGSGVIGRAVGNHAATKAARKGDSDEEVMEKGKKVAGHVGAVAGGLAGAAGVGTNLKLSGISSKGVGNDIKKVVGKAIKPLHTKLQEKGKHEAAAKVKKVMRKVGKANGTKVGRIAAGVGIGAGALTAGALGRAGARMGAKKAIQKRTEMAQTERDNR